MSWLYSLVLASLLLSSDTVPGSNGQNLDHAHKATKASVKMDETEKFDQTYPLSANGRVELSNVNGSIIVEAWDRNEVRVEATKIADSKESLDAVEIRVDARPDAIDIETDYKDWKWSEKNEWKKSRKIEVQFKLSVPRTAMLNEVETVNGSVTVANFTNLTKVSAVNGNVNASNLRGTANLSTVNGEVVADFDRLETGSRINLDTVNGSVNLTIPSDSDATIKADSLNGNITNEFGLPVRKGEYVGRDLYGKLGSGSVNIRLNSVNGPLAINRKKDGKNINPATNLLPAKRGDKVDDDDDSMLRLNTNKANRDVARAMRDAQRATSRATRDAAKATADAMRDSEKAMRNLNIDLEGLKNIKVDIDDKAIERSIEEGMRAHQNAMVRLRDASWFGGTPTMVRKTNSFAINGASKLTVNGKNCDVRVRGWDKPEIKYTLTDFSNRESDNSVSVTEDQSPSGVTLNVSGNDTWFGGDHAPRLEIYVPRKSDLKIVTKGEIRLEGVSGSIDLDGEDGAINVRGSDGKLNVANVDGTVRVIGFRGDLMAKTVDGEIYLDGDFSKIDGESNSGKIVLTVPADIAADIESPADAVSVQNLTNSKKLSDTTWRLGGGGRKYTFTGDDSSIVVQNRDAIFAEK